VVLEPREEVKQTPLPWVKAFPPQKSLCCPRYAPGEVSILSPCCPTPQRPSAVGVKPNTADNASMTKPRSRGYEEFAHSVTEGASGGNGDCPGFLRVFARAFEVEVK
jgi:hypothetical protein